MTQPPAKSATSPLTTSAAAARLEVSAEIARLQANGYGPTVIARSLNMRRIPTPSGRGQWWPDTVRRHIDPGAWAAYMRGYRQRRGW